MDLVNLNAFPGNEKLFSFAIARIPKIFDVMRNSTVGLIVTKFL